jgi:hypothetical protein
MESTELLLPPGHSSVLSEVWIDSIARPNLTDEVSLVVNACLDEHTLVATFSVSCVVFCYGDASIHNWNELHVLRVETVNKRAEVSEVSRIVGKVFVVIKVVNINPLGVKRNTSF